MSEQASPHDTSTAWLIGAWQLLRCESPLEIEPGTRMHFRATGELEYAIPTGDRLMRVTLMWRLEGGMLHTAHTDGSHPVQVAITHGEGDVMTLDFGGPRAWYVRAR